MTAIAKNRAGLLLAFALVLAALWARPAAALEEILDFRSDIAVARDGSLTVRETITVRSERDQIRRGIFRDYPTTYRDRTGNRVRVRFDVRGVTRNGHSEPYEIENLSNGKRVRIGSADVFLDEGEHTYVILYETNRQIGFFDSYDELYWNVTGTGWEFPIRHAEARIHLPRATAIGQYDFYTGPEGARAKNATARVEGGGSIFFETTLPLAQYEGLTVAVAFEKGVVTPPTAAEKTESFLRDNAASGAALAGLLFLTLYYMAAWWKFGRDPARGPIVPLFEPPKNFSPAAVRDVHRMGYDRKAFSSSLVNMAVKGFMKIEEDDGEYVLRRTGKSEMQAGLDKGEQAIARGLFGSGDTVALKNSNHVRISGAITGLRRALKNEYEKAYFITNRGWFIAGLAILALSAAAAALLSEQPEATTFMLFWISGWSVGTAFLVHRAHQLWTAFFRGPGSRIVNFGGALVASLFALPFVVGLFAVLGILGSSLPLVVTFALIVQGVLAYVFYHLLKAPTLAGAKIRDQIDGFRMFLVAAEQERLEKLHPPEITPEVFEKYLPYAIALDAENEWSRKFEAATAKAGIEADKAYRPAWYSGPSFSRAGTGGFALAIGASVATAAAAASAAPGRSSGSGGGGSSGGGGGGGGGGGW
ncbi:MAG: DUF2207 domain-containing protein [Alphaproteobacteria bacterium]